MTNSSSNAQKGMFWQKVKSSVEMDIEPGILTVSLFRNDPTENFHYKRKFTILQSYGHAPCVCTSSTAKLFNVYLNEVKNGKHNRVEKHLESNEIALYSKGFGTWRSFIDMESPSEAELYQLKNPIRTIKGEKKFKLQFDMSKFLPKNVKVWMDSKNSCLTIDMHHTVDGANMHTSGK
uniref:Uncharacterized protein n=1 Tax=Ditylenchus dipsaci TaxID=166011 RepID=A0A915EAN5_9BILA